MQTLIEFNDNSINYSVEFSVGRGRLSSLYSTRSNPRTPDFLGYTIASNVTNGNPDKILYPGNYTTSLPGYIIYEPVPSTNGAKWNGYLSSNKQTLNIVNDTEYARLLNQVVSYYQCGLVATVRFGNNYPETRCIEIAETALVSMIYKYNYTTPTITATSCSVKAQYSANTTINVQEILTKVGANLYMPNGGVAINYSTLNNRDIISGLSTTKPANTVVNLYNSSSNIIINSMNTLYSPNILNLSGHVWSGKVGSSNSTFNLRVPASFGAGQDAIAISMYNSTVYGSNQYYDTRFDSTNYIYVPNKQNTILGYGNQSINGLILKFPFSNAFTIKIAIDTSASYILARTQSRNASTNQSPAFTPQSLLAEYTANPTFFSSGGSGATPQIIRRTTAFDALEQKMGIVVTELPAAEWGTLQYYNASTWTTLPTYFTLPFDAQIRFAAIKGTTPLTNPLPQFKYRSWEPAPLSPTTAKTAYTSVSVPTDPGRSTSELDFSQQESTVQLTVRSPPIMLAGQVITV